MFDSHGTTSSTPELIGSVLTDDETALQTISPTAHRTSKRKARKLEVTQPTQGDALSPSEKLLCQWLRQLHFRVYASRITLSGNTQTFLTAHRAQKGHLASYFSWKFYKAVPGIKLATVLPPAAITTSYSGRLPIDALPTVIMETQIVSELMKMRVKLPQQVISVPEYWKEPFGVPYTGVEPSETLERYLEMREQNRRNLIGVLNSGGSAIKWRKSDDPYFKDIMRTAPNVTLNEGYFLDNFSRLVPILTSPPTSQPITAERSVELDVIGPQVNALYRLPLTTTTGNESIPCPIPLGPFGSLARPDVAMVMNLEDWGMNFAPLCFAGETKTADEKDDNTPAQLAWSLHSSINLLILYHLHHRTSVQDSFPSWMYIYGVIQDQNGVEIYAHYPRMVFKPESQKYGAIGPNSGPTMYPHWGYGSVLVTDKHQFSFKQGINQRFGLLSALLTVQAHAHFLTTEFRKWKPTPEEMLELRECAVEFLLVVTEPIASVPPSPLGSFSDLRSTASPPPVNRSKSKLQVLPRERRRSLRLKKKGLENVAEDSNDIVDVAGSSGTDHFEEQSGEN